MASTKQHRTWIYDHSRQVVAVGLAILIACGLALVTTPIAQAQSFKVIYPFTGGLDGANPFAGLTMDKAGSLYGTTYDGSAGYGTVFKLKHTGSSWVLSPLYSFQGRNDGANPQARVVFGPNGSLYGTTSTGGKNFSGTVFKLAVPPSACKTALCPWFETVLYRFTGGDDGANPQYGDLVFDQAGNVYGTTVNGGSNNVGTVYELTPSGGSWVESVIHAFNFNGNDGNRPFSGVILDKAGNLYGTTSSGGPNGFGTVFQLTPSGSGWTENILYSFQAQADGMAPEGGLILDAAGNLYGTTATGGFGGGGGTVFELTPSGGGWNFSLLHSFPGFVGPLSTLAMDAAGNLYGTTFIDGAYGYGSVFKLTHSGGFWTFPAFTTSLGLRTGETRSAT
jgi:uncharacterized repeat protein (TIGR03803 family)